MLCEKKEKSAAGSDGWVVIKSSQRPRDREQGSLLLEPREKQGRPPVVEGASVSGHLGYAVGMKGEEVAPLPYLPELLNAPLPRTSPTIHD